MIFHNHFMGGLSKIFQKILSVKTGFLGLVTALGVALVFAPSGFDQADAQSKKKKQKAALLALAKKIDVVRNAEDDAWRSLDPQNTVVMELPNGEVIIELRPDLAPVTATRIRELVSEKFYDGLKFHRVIQGFVAQGGDPKGDGTGGSTKPDIVGEFTKNVDLVEDFTEIGRDRVAARVGYVNGMPVAAQPNSLGSFLANGEVKLWGIHCPGTLSMARATNPNSGNSQFFFVIGDARQGLDTRYTAWGWAVHGFRHSKRISRGEPPERPTPILRMRLASQIPEEERQDIKVFDTNRPEFLEYLKALGKVKDGLVGDMCDIKVPTKIDGAVSL